MSEDNFTPREKYKIHSNILHASGIINDMLYSVHAAYKELGEAETNKILEAKLYSDSLHQVLKELNGLDG